MSRRANTGFRDGSYTLPAGHLNAKEALPVAIAREAMEECGILVKPENVKLLSIIHRPNKSREYMDFFCSVDNWEGEVTNMEPDKCDDLSWFPMDSLPD
eukprot:CAMPEP_0184289722 /NCGR_PEP_ID=MMETSP1049-20130417/2097_1 /TAXON_ID=77928 /ORGANISM="Proteomonas sulcata, Strain CCMP704" /LENGTH=98 /DNA_ID=CAMNT_0026596609 /DNA_START=329 /DNA_END=622 /DNA_ORIENTATION=-